MHSKELSRLVFSSLVCACLLAAIPVSVFAQTLNGVDQRNHPRPKRK